METMMNLVKDLGGAGALATADAAGVMAGTALAEAAGAGVTAGDVSHLYGAGTLHGTGTRSWRTYSSNPPGLL